MNLIVWRFVVIDNTSPPAVVKGPWTHPDAELIYAYETSELAAFSLAMQTDDALPALTLRERIDLPLHYQASEYYVPTRSQLKAIATGDPEQWPVFDLASHMQKKKLFSVWIPSLDSHKQHLVLINTGHPLFGEVKIRSSVQVTNAGKRSRSPRLDAGVPA